MQTTMSRTKIEIRPVTRTLPYWSFFGGFVWSASPVVARRIVGLELIFRQYTEIYANKLAYATASAPLHPLELKKLWLRYAPPLTQGSCPVYGWERNGSLHILEMREVEPRNFAIGILQSGWTLTGQEKDTQNRGEIEIYRASWACIRDGLNAVYVPRCRYLRVICIGRCSIIEWVWGAGGGCRSEENRSCA